MLIDDFNKIIEDKIDEIKQNVKLDLKKDVTNDIDYHSNLFLKLMNFKHRTLYGQSYQVNILEIFIKFLKLSAVKAI